MSTPRKVPITAIKIIGTVMDVGAEACKAMPPGRRHRYFVDTSYVLSDGSEIPGRERAMSRPKLKQALENTERCIGKGMYHAEQWDSGWSIMISISLR